MVMKNKLYKHHKKKAFFVFRNFAFAFVGLAVVTLSFAIPTYISQQNETKIEAKTALSNAKENTEEPEVLSISEDIR